MQPATGISEEEKGKESGKVEEPARSMQPVSVSTNEASTLPIEAA